MSKSFDIVMAGLISGIVALTTTFLGVAGTVIGAVLGAILYQIISIFVKEPLENATVKKVEREIVYIIPLVLIAVFLAIFIVALLHSYSFYYPDFLEFFKQLEEITNNSLVRFMGIGLIVMGIYPLLQQKTVKKEYGLIILILGTLLLVRGLLDMSPDLFYFYTETFGFFDVVLNIIILLILVFIIIKILVESISLYMGRNKNISVDEYKNAEITKNQDYVRNDSRFKSRINNKKEYNRNNIEDIDDFSISDSDDFSINDNDSVIDDNIINDSTISDNAIDNENLINKKRLFRNKTIKSDKTSTMPKYRKFFKR